MKLIDLFRLSLSRLGTGRLRTALTMLGIVIGVASVVALVSVGQGATSGVSSRLQSLGTNLITVNAGASTSSGTRGLFGSATTLTLDDATALAKLDGVAGVAPELSTSKLVLAGDENTTTTVVGTTADYLLVRAYEIWQGSGLTTPSVERALRVCVLGSTTADDLGLDQAAVGTDIMIGGLPFRIVGIMQSKGGSGFQSPDDEVLIPVTTARELFVSSDSVRSIGVSVSSADEMETVKAEITATLETRHGITSSASDDFTIQDQSQLLSTVGDVSTLLTVLLAGIASISLVVGGIGIMNIMLVSVTERTREIGLRMAVGAKPWNVLVQFLAESIALSTMGGVLGIAMGIVAARVVASRFGFPFAMRVDMAFVAFAFSALVGIVFGLYPARKAAELDPIDALRYE